MIKRFEMGVVNASPSPGNEGISNTIATCCFQSSAFNWSYYTQSVENKLCSSISGFVFTPDHLRQLSSVLMGALDYLYIVQRFPKAGRSPSLIQWA